MIEDERRYSAISGSHCEGSIRGRGSSASETSAVTPLGPEHAKDGVPDTIRFD